MHWQLESSLHWLQLQKARAQERGPHAPQGRYSTAKNKNNFFLKNEALGLPWWSRGLNIMLPIQEAQDQTPVRELDPTCYSWVCMPQLKILYTATKTQNSQKKKRGTKTDSSRKKQGQDLNPCSLTLEFMSFMFLLCCLCDWGRGHDNGKVIWLERLIQQGLVMNGEVVVKGGRSQGWWNKQSRLPGRKTPRNCSEPGDLPNFLQACTHLIFF